MMFFSKTRLLVIMLGLTAGLFALPADSNAQYLSTWAPGYWGQYGNYRPIFGNRRVFSDQYGVVYRRPLFGRIYRPVGQTVYPAVATVAAPVSYNTVAYSPMGCSTCSTGCSTGCSPCDTGCSTCTSYRISYRPQTCYRTQVVNVPVTSYVRTVARDACTGCAVTAMRPVTTYVRQVQRIPYTSYSPVYSPSSCSTCSYGACSTCGSGLSATGTCSTCSPLSTSAATGIPNSNLNSTPQPSLNNNNPGQSYPADQNEGESRTFKKEEAQPQPKENELQPIPNRKSATGIFSPQLTDPQDRTTQVAPKSSNYVRHATYTQPKAQTISQEEIDAQGWTAVK